MFDKRATDNFNDSPPDSFLAVSGCHKSYDFFNVISFILPATPLLHRLRIHHANWFAVGVDRAGLLLGSAAASFRFS